MGRIYGRYTVQCPKLTKPYSFNYLPPLICKNALVKSVKHTGLVSFRHWRQLFVIHCTHGHLSYLLCVVSLVQKVVFCSVDVQCRGASY